MRKQFVSVLNAFDYLFCFYLNGVDAEIGISVDGAHDAERYIREHGTDADIAHMEYMMSVL